MEVGGVDQSRLFFALALLATSVSFTGCHPNAGSARPTASPGDVNAIIAAGRQAEQSQSPTSDGSLSTSPEASANDSSQSSTQDAKTPVPYEDVSGDLHVESATYDEATDPDDPTKQIYVVVIKGSLENTFEDENAECNSAEFTLIGNGRTFSSQDDDSINTGCESDEVAKGTSTPFTLEFKVHSKGEYSLRYDMGGLYLHHGISL